MRIMAQDPNHLIWIDMEMSGLYPDTDRVLEIAIVVTDSQLVTVAEAPVKIVHQPDAVLDRMDSWNKSTHRKSGLIDKVKAANDAIERPEPFHPSCERVTRTTGR